jgi:hypothetical protein
MSCPRGVFSTVEEASDRAAAILFNVDAELCRGLSIYFRAGFSPRPSSREGLVEELRMSNFEFSNRRLRSIHRGERRVRRDSILAAELRALSELCGEEKQIRMAES